MNKWFRRFLYLIAGLLTLIIVVFLWLQTDWAKNVIRKKIQSYVSTKTNTEFLIGSIDYRLPDWVELNGVLMRDMQKDTLLFGNKIRANVAMLQLLKGKYQVDKILLDNMLVNLVQQETDSVFNYQFIVDAFKSKSETTTSKDTTLIDLSLDELVLKNVRFNMLDNKTGSFTRMRVKDFTMRVNNLDLNTMSFDIEKLYTDELNFQLLLQNKITSSKPAQAAPIWPSLKIDSVVIKNSFIDFEDETNKIKSVNTIGQLQLLALNNQQNNRVLLSKSIELSNSKIKFDHFLTAKKSAETTLVTVSDTLIKATDLGFAVEKMQLTNNNITYNNDAMPATINGLDYAHLDIKELSLNATKSSYLNGNLESTIENFAFKDKSGFQLDSLRGYVNMDSGNIEIKNFYAKTPTSVIRANAIVYPSSLTNPGNGRAGTPQNNILLSNTIISKKDLELLADGVTRNYKKQLDDLGDVLINADIRGDARRLAIRYLDVRSTNGRPFNLQLTGTASNISDIKLLAYNLNVKNLTLTKGLIQPFIPQKGQPINLPPLMNIKGLFSGNLNNVKTNMQLNTAFGNLTTSGTLNNIQNPATLQYDLNILATNFETGKWVFKEDQIGKITGNIKAKGSNGFNYKTAKINTTANIRSVRIQELLYQNLRFTLLLSGGVANFVAAINDSKINANVKGKANIKSQYPSLNAFANIRNADLRALGLTTDSLQISTLANIDVNNSSPQNLDGNLRLDSTQIITGSQKIYLDSAIIAGFVRNDSTLFTIVSALADGTVASNLNYQQIPVLLQEVLAYYYKPKNNSTTPKASQGSLTAEFTLKPSDTYKAFINDLSFKNTLVNAFITNQQRDSAVKATITAEQLKVGANNIANLNARISGTKDTLLMLVNADSIKSGNILLFETDIKAGFANNNLSAGITTKDNKKVTQYALAFDASQNKSTGGYAVKLKDGLILNYDNWQVNNNNRLITEGKNFNVRDFDIINNQQKIAIGSLDAAMNAPLKINIQNFQLNTITSALNQDSAQVQGLLNTQLTVSDFSQAIPTADGVISVDSIVYQQMSVGNLNVKAKSRSGVVSVSGKLDGNNNNVDIDGSYNANKIDLKLILNPLSLSTVQPFTSGNLVRSSGTISGPINIFGAVANPTWNGELTLNKVQTTVASFGTLLKIDGQKLILKYPDILLNDLLVKDSAGNDLKINGSLTQGKDYAFSTDLSLATKNFTAIDNVPTDNNMLYGKAIVELDATMKGPIATPELVGNVVVKNGTELTYVQQTLPSSIKEREKVMEFVDMDSIPNLVARNNMPDVPGQENVTRSAGSLKYNLDLEIEKEAKVNVILDPTTRDELQLQGSAQLTTSVNPNGTVDITGTYNLVSGSYQLNYGPVEKKFILQPGSTITMTGDPLNAQADITAIYEINTSPIELVGNEIGGSNAAENAAYRRKVPFQVLLKIKGTVSAPELSFDIVIKDKSEGISYETSTTIENKLDQLRKDASAMNKQVFALLALNRFIGDRSTDFFGGNGIINSDLLANASVTGFLNSAVQQLAGNLIKGVDIDVNLKNVDEDASSSRTDLNVSLGKTFLNDRLNVSFEKSFTVYGADDANNGANTSDQTQFLPDINATYKISKDGRYMLRAYRRNQYEAIMDGYFIESGVAFSLSMDYDNFKEILRRKKK